MTQVTANDLEKLSCKKADVKTIITFRNEQLLNLWINEMQGQISDGMWENSRHTDWLWKDVWYQLGTMTKVEVNYSYHIGKKSYPLVKELWDVIGYRMWGERDETGAGYKTEKEVRAAWKEINEAIYNATEFSQDVRAEIRKAEDERCKIKANLYKKAEAERDSLSDQPSYSGHVYGIYLDPENRKGYKSIEIKVLPDKNMYYFIVGDMKVCPNMLKEAVKAYQDFFKNNYTILTAY